MNTGDMAVKAIREYAASLAQRDHVRGRVGCPDCGAPPGYTCIRRGRETRLLHAGRWKVFSGGLLKTSRERNAIVMVPRKETSRRAPMMGDVLAGWDMKPAREQGYTASGGKKGRR